jgi:hypothetical protein
MEIKTILKEEITDEMSELSKLEIGSDKYKATVEGVTKLVDRVVELEKIDAERDEKLRDRNINLGIQDERLRIEKRDKIATHVLTGVSIAVTTVVTIWGTFKTLKFEETGTVTTFAGKNFINKLFSKKG